MEITVYISLASVLIAFIALIRNGRKDTQADAATQAVITTKLDNINNGVTDIRVDMRTMRSDLNAIESRVIRVEERCKSNSHRLDMLDKGEKE